MTPQERQLVDDLFDRLSKVENAPRDPEAVEAIGRGLRNAPNAVYALVQAVLLQDEALKRADSRIQQLESAGAGEQQQSGGFLDSMRDAIFGQNQPRGSVPNVPLSQPSSRPVWNSGQVMPQSQPGAYGQGSYAPPYGAPSATGGGGSFLGTAAAAAAGMVGGSLLLGSIRSMMGGGHQGFGDSAGLGGTSEGHKAWSDQSRSDLAREAGIDDIDSTAGGSSDNSRTGLFDTASNDYDSPDDMDMESDDFGSGDVAAALGINEEQTLHNVEISGSVGIRF